MYFKLFFVQKDVYALDGIKMSKGLFATFHGKYTHKVSLNNQYDLLYANKIIFEKCKLV